MLKFELATVSLITEITFLQRGASKQVIFRIGAEEAFMEGVGGLRLSCKEIEPILAIMHALTGHGFVDTNIDSEIQQVFLREDQWDNAPSNEDTQIEPASA